MTAPLTADLTGVPETTLWTLHNRANEAMRRDGAIRDPEAIRIYRGISYDYARSFGAPDGSHALRARLFDDALREWLQVHPDGQVVELGCGLETQLYRCDNGEVRWLAVDVPEILTVRERFIRHPRCTHLAGNALDPDWMSWVDPDRPVFISAQGLLMYFEEEAVARLLGATIERFAQATLVFDVVPRWFSLVARWGLLRKTRHYAAPAMPWGLNRREIVPRVRRWTGATRVTVVPYGPIRGAWGFLFKRLSRWPGLRAHVGHVVRTCGPAAAVTAPERAAARLPSTGTPTSPGHRVFGPRDRPAADRRPRGTTPGGGLLDGDDSASMPPSTL